MNTINAQTPGPLHVGMKPGPMLYGPKGEQVADLTADLLERAENAANARLLAAAYTMVDKAARELGIDAVELAERTDLAALIRAARDYCNPFVDRQVVHDALRKAALQSLPD